MRGVCLLRLLGAALGLLGLVSAAGAEPKVDVEAAAQVDADALYGMVLLGAFGDALGAPTENDGTSGMMMPPERRRCWLTPASAWYEEEDGGNCWGVWPWPDQISEGMAPMTDDTSQRVALLEPWLATVLDQAGEQEAGIVLDEADYIAFVSETSDTLWAQEDLHDEEGWYGMRTREIAANTLCSWAAAGTEGAACNESEGSNVFYFEDPTAVCWGLYQDLELGALFSAPHYSAHDVYSFMRTWDSLDNDENTYAGVVTGWSAALLARAVRATPTSPQDLVPLLEEAVYSWLPEWEMRARKSDAVEAQHLRQVYVQLDAWYQLGVETQGKSEEAFLEAFAELYASPLVNQSNSMKPHDPAVLMGVNVAASVFTSDLPSAFRLITSTSTDTDTGASFWGLITGAFYGNRLLRRPDWFTCDGKPFAVQLDRMENFLSDPKLFDYDMAATVQLFQQLAPYVTIPGRR